MRNETTWGQVKDEVIKKFTDGLMFQLIVNKREDSAIKEEYYITSDPNQILSAGPKPGQTSFENDFYELRVLHRSIQGQFRESLKNYMPEFFNTPKLPSRYDELKHVETGYRKTLTEILKNFSVDVQMMSDSVENLIMKYGPEIQNLLFYIEERKGKLARGETLP